MHGRKTDIRTFDGPVDIDEASSIVAEGAPAFGWFAFPEKNKVGGKIVKSPSARRTKTALLRGLMTAVGVAGTFLWRQRRGWLVKSPAGSLMGFLTACTRQRFCFKQNRPPCFGGGNMYYYRGRASLESAYVQYMSMVPLVREKGALFRKGLAQSARWFF